MSGYLLTPAARSDLGHILRAAERWSAGQADRYFRLLGETCRDLAEGHIEGDPVPEIRAGYRRLPLGPYVLFYRTTEAGLINVVRILREPMDVLLPPPPGEPAD